MAMGVPVDLWVDSFSCTACRSGERVNAQEEDGVGCLSTAMVACFFVTPPAVAISVKRFVC